MSEFVLVVSGKNAPDVVLYNPTATETKPRVLSIIELLVFVGPGRKSAATISTEDGVLQPFQVGSLSACLFLKFKLDQGLVNVGRISEGEIATNVQTGAEASPVR